MDGKRILDWHKMEKGHIRLEPLIREFEIHNRSEGKSLRTVGWYNEVLNLFFRWVTARSYSTRLDDIDKGRVQEFIIHLQDRPSPRGKPSTYTVNNRVRGLRAFFNWLFHEGYTADNILGGLRPPRVAELTTEPLTDEEALRLFKNLDPSAAYGARNTAILALFLDTGVRLTELVELRPKDVHVEDQYVKVTGKGNKERIVPFGVTTQKVLLRYILHFRPDEAHPNVDQFFLSLEGTPLSAAAIKSFLSRCGRASNVPRLHAHLLRHTYATNFLLNGGDLLLLKQNLGHTTFAMVDRYVHLASRRAAILSRRFSPLDRVNIPGMRLRSDSARSDGRLGHIAYRRISDRKTKGRNPRGA